MAQTVQLAIMPACLLEDMEASQQIPRNTFRVRLIASSNMLFLIPTYFAGVRSDVPGSARGLQAIKPTTKADHAKCQLECGARGADTFSNPSSNRS